MTQFIDQFGPIIGSPFALVVGILMIVFRRKFSRLSWEMNSEEKIEPDAVPPFVYSPVWAAFVGCGFIAGAVILGLIGIVRLANG